MRPLQAPETKLVTTTVDAVALDGTFTGHAAIFGVEDLAHDVIERGAFTASLGRRGPDGIKMLWHHDPAEPIGRWLEIREDGRGLFVRGQLLTTVARGREALALMTAGVLDGLSIGFRTVKGARARGTAVRRLTQVDLWEISLVTFPMQPQARVSAVATRSSRTRGFETRADLPAHRLAATIRRAASLFETTR
jgi:uncharacterized protein